MTHGDPTARIVRDLAPEVLAAALARAREQAVTRLADLLTEALVAEALAAMGSPGRGQAPPPPEPPPPEPPPPEPVRPEPARPEAPPPEAAPTAPVLYAYAITRGDLPPIDDAPALVPGEPVGRVTDADLALLVSRVTPDALQVDEDDLSEGGRLATLARAHDAVIRTAAAVGPVLPLRFGTVVPDEDAARRLLRTHADPARRRLDRIGDTREWGVRLVRRMDAEPALAARPTAQDGEEISGTEFLARRRQALQERETAGEAAARAAGRLEEELGPHVTESVRRGGSPGSSLLLDLACLVPPDREEGFAAAVDRLRGEMGSDGLEIEVSGPWPPYSFASLDAGGPDGP